MTGQNGLQPDAAARFVPTVRWTAVVVCHEAVSDAAELGPTSTLPTVPATAPHHHHA